MNTDLPLQWFTKLKARVIALPNPADKFPNIPLTIPEPFVSLKASSVGVFLTSRMFLFNFMVGFLLMAMVIVGKDIQLNSARLETVDLQRRLVMGRINTWENVINEYPGYRDGYYQLAVLEQQVGNKQRAYEYMQKALAIDPDFSAGKQFIEKLVR